MKRRGIFITLEGIDGTGKSTQFRLLVEELRRLRFPVVATREPGGTRTGERVRDILLASKTGNLAPLAELALMYAARAQHVDEVVRPALKRGEIVVSDRYNDSSFAYQGYGRKLGVEVVRAFDRAICGTTQPDLTIVLDLSPRAAILRAMGRETRQRSRHGRFEAQGLAFHNRVRRGYLEIAKREPGRVKVVNANRPVDFVWADIAGHVLDKLAKRGFI
jgi:dTMP kinase